MNLFRVLLLSILLPLTQVSLAEDYVDLLNLSGYEEGDIPTHLLGEQITVRQEVKDGKIIKFVSGQASDGKINYNISNLARDFEMIFEFSFRTSMLISFTASDKEAKFGFVWDCWYMQLGNNSSGSYSNIGCNEDLATQTLKIKVEAGSIKTYVNSKFFQSMTLEQPDKVYNELLITGVAKEDKLYTMKVSNLGSSTTPITSPDTTIPTTATLAAEFEKGKQAGIQQCVTDPLSCGLRLTINTAETDGCIANYATNGELHIPCVNVPGAFGKIDTYDVWLQQQSGSFTFDLDLTRIQLK